MGEFGLDEATMKGDGWLVEFSNLEAKAQVVAAAPSAGTAPIAAPAAKAKPKPAKKETPKGTPITSPMNGIYYSSPSPSSPPFVKEGETVTAGQVVALIEAMKVFNEVTAVTGGTVLKIVASNGQLVQPGDVLFTLA